MTTPILCVPVSPAQLHAILTQDGAQWISGRTSYSAPSYLALAAQFFTDAD